MPASDHDNFASQDRLFTSARSCQASGWPIPWHPCRGSWLQDGQVARRLVKNFGYSDYNVENAIN